METTPTDYKGLVDGILEITNLLIAAIFAVVLLVLIYKIFDAWVINGGDEEKREAGKQYAFVGVIVLVVMISVWSLVKLIQGTLF